MAGYLKNLGNAFLNKSHSSGNIPLTSHLTTIFKKFSSYFLFNLGDNTLEEWIQAYGRNPLVAQVVDRIAMQSASIKRVAFDENGGPIEEDDSELLSLLANPNTEQSQIEFYEDLGKNYEATGNAFVRFVEGIGAGEELRVLPSNKVEIVCDQFDNVTAYKWTTPNGSIISIPAEEVLHIKESNIVHTDGKEAKYGLSKLHAAMVSVVASDEKLKAEASIFKNKGIAGILTTAKDTPMLPKERQRLQDELDTDIGGSDKFNKLHVTTSDLRYLQTGMSPEDLKLIESIVSSLRLICSVYGLSSVLFNDVANSTYNNVTTAEVSAWFQVYIPTANKFDDKLSRFLSEKLGVNETIKVDLTSIEAIKATTNEVAQQLNNLPTNVLPRVIANMTQEEIRSIVPALGDLAEDAEVIGESTSTNTNNNNDEQG